MLKLNDPFEMNDLFLGIFYNAENEALANAGKGSQKSSQRLKQLYRRVNALWRKLLRAVDGVVPPIWHKASTLMDKVSRLHTEEEAPPNAMTASQQFDAVSDENAAFEFRPLTKGEKGQFLNSLNGKGRRILAELQGEAKKRRSGRSPARVAEPNPVGVAPDMQMSDKGMFSTPNTLFEIRLQRQS